MANVTPQEMADRLRRFATGTGEGSLRAALVEVAEDAGPLVAQESVSNWMRDDGGALTIARSGRRRFRRRSPSDKGPIRILSGRLARAVRAPDGKDGGIQEVSTRTEGSGLTVRLTKGVDARVAPGAYNEDRIARSGRDLSFLAPAAREARPDIVSLARKRVHLAARRALGV